MALSLTCTPKVTGRCTDCGGSTFCNMAHGGDHDHTQQAMNCTAAKLADAKQSSVLEDALQGYAAGLVQRNNEQNPQRQMYLFSPLNIVHDTALDGSQKLLWVVVEDVHGNLSYLAADAEGRLVHTDTLALL